MPAAAKIVEKPVSGELTNGKSKLSPSNGNGSSYVSSISMLQEPQKIANTIIEKKIRNLEKRKVRLLEIKALEDKGQQLEADQKNAVKKLDNVVEMIDMLKEIGKNVTDSLNDYAKQIKKQQKKEQSDKQAERQQQDLDRSKMWLNVQFISSRFAQAKNDLLKGENGAIKLAENQIEALDKFIETVFPQNVESIDACAEKFNSLFDGNKRVFHSGLSYLEIKEIIAKMVESNYFDSISEDISQLKDTSLNPTIPEVETVISTTEATIPSPKKPSSDEVKSEEPVVDTAPVHHLNPQLCFMRDTVVENELQHKDPAVVAVASSGFAFQQLGQALSTSSGSNVSATSETVSSHFSTAAHHIYPAVTIPTQTFTNQNYTALMPNANRFIPVPLHTQPLIHQIPAPEPSVSIRSVNSGPEEAVLKSDKSFNDSPLEKADQFSSDASNVIKASHDADTKPISNIPFENGSNNNYNKRGGGRSVMRGNGRGNFSNNYRGRSGKNFGSYFNNPNNANPQNASFNRAPINRQNGVPNRHPGTIRQGGPPRNQNYQSNNQPAAVPAK